MNPPSPLEDSLFATAAWARYKRLMRWMVVLTVVTVTAAMAFIYAKDGPVSVHFYIAVGLGIGVSMLLMSALMGLVFLSNSSGHDAAVTQLDDDQSAG